MIPHQTEHNGPDKPGGAMRAAAASAQRDKPVVLLVLQGAHHLDLFGALLTQCRGLRWVCLVHDLQRVPRAMINALHTEHDVRFFTDTETAMLHFADIDALVTTFALPHRAHVPYLGLIGLAHDVGMPVFELQHGLFQSGISFHADGPLVGSGMAQAQNGLFARNLTQDKLTWWGDDSIGYPRHIHRETEYPAQDADAGLPQAEAPAAPTHRPKGPRNGGPVAVLTNLHWALLSPEEAQTGYAMIMAAITALPDLQFALMPHPAEVKTAAFIRMCDRLDQARAPNWRLLLPQDHDARAEVMRHAWLALASASTVLLDLEMNATPTLLLGLRQMIPLYAALDCADVVRDAPALTRAIAETAAGIRDPYLRTGRLCRFDPAALEARITAAIPPQPRPVQDVVAALHRYIKTG